MELDITKPENLSDTINSQVSSLCVLSLLLHGAEGKLFPSLLLIFHYVYMCVLLIIIVMPIKGIVSYAQRLTLQLRAINLFSPMNLRLFSITLCFTPPSTPINFNSKLLMSSLEIHFSFYIYLNFSSDLNEDLTNLPAFESLYNSLLLSSVRMGCV